MFRRVMGLIALIGLSVVFVGCATNGKTEQATIQSDRQIDQNMKNVPQQDLHGTSSEAISGKDITPGR